MLYHIKFDAKNVYKATEALEKYQRVSLDETEIQKLKLPKIFNRNQLTITKNAYDYSLSMIIGSVLYGDFTLTIDPYYKKLVARRRLSSWRVIFLLIWWVICIYTSVCGYMISDAYTEYQVEPGDYQILAGLILGLAVTMGINLLWTYGTSRLMQAYIEKYIIVARKGDAKQIAATKEFLAQKSGKTQRKEQQSEKAQVKKTDAIITKNLETQHESKAQKTRLKDYDPNFKNTSINNPYKYLENERYAFFCSESGIIQKTAFASLHFDDTLILEDDQTSSGFKLFKGIRNIRKNLQLIWHSQSYDAILLAKGNPEDSDSADVYAYKDPDDDNLVRVARDYNGLIRIRYNGETDPNGVCKVWISDEEPYQCFPGFGNETRLKLDLNVIKKKTKTLVNKDKIKEVTSKKDFKKKSWYVVWIIMLLILARTWFVYGVAPNAGYKELLPEFDDTTYNASDPRHYDGNTTEEYRWAAHATSIYAKLLNGNPDVLCGTAVNTQQELDTYTAFLRLSWGIDSRSSAKEKLNKTIKYGYRAKYKTYVKSNSDVKKAIKAIKRDFGEDLTFGEVGAITADYFEKNHISTDEFLKVKAAACTYIRFGESGLDAYDYLRLIRTTYLCYKCGYLSRNEYLGFIAKLNDAMKYEYYGFEEIHECYYYGEMFRRKELNTDNLSTTNDIRSAINLMMDTGYYYKIDQEY